MKKRIGELYKKVQTLREEVDKKNINNKIKVVKMINHLDYRIQNLENLDEKNTINTKLFNLIALDLNEMINEIKNTINKSTYS